MKGADNQTTYLLFVLTLCLEYSCMLGFFLKRIHHNGDSEYWMCKDVIKDSDGLKYKSDFGTASADKNVRMLKHIR